MIYIPNPAFEEQFLASPEAKEVVQPTAEMIAQQARASAPVLTGAYRDSIKVEGDQVIADDDKAVYIEFGTSDTPTFATLRKAAEAVVGKSVGRR